ncbi:MAG TPA: SDR family oxidoreductase [Solirubrobacteraceae bacterium]|nr:SDR family oxidoreductase [Solirubrobacteraceae bacterium]
MRLSGRVAVVTGGASGIGTALARRVVAEDAAGVVVADLDGAGAEAVARDLGDRAIGVGCDVTDEAALRAVLARAEDAFGPVDAFFANAGVAVGGDEQTPDDTWDLAFAVNVRAHVVAARLLVPGWLERGEGCFVAVASAAGLLTQIGVAPYCVTKHAAVAFAEWLSVTYGDRGVHVACVCPMGVDTPMLAAGMDTAAAASVRSAGGVLTPADVAAAVVDGLAEERFLILPHPEVLEFFRRKTSDYDRWLAGMRRLRRAVESPGHDRRCTGGRDVRADRHLQR